MRKLPVVAARPRATSSAPSTPGDRRRNVVTMTPTGRRRLRQLDRLLARMQDQLLAPLSPKERTCLITLLTRLVDHHANA